MLARSARGAGPAMCPVVVYRHTESDDTT